MGVLVSQDRYARTIKDPDDGTEYVVTFRHLSGFERNRIQAMRTSDEGGELDMGHVKARAIETAVVSWTLPVERSWENICQLRGEVFDRLYEYVSLDGEAPPQVKDEADLPLGPSESATPPGEASAGSA